ncbi:MAG: SHOCT domain-containing protein [Flavobacteriales bacterium]
MRETPKDILDSRFAKGQISKEEYEEQKRIINTKIK